MTWTRLDDGFPTHPKVMNLTDGGFRALVTGLCYSNQHLTDGFIPNGVVKTRYAVELCAKHIWKIDNRGGYLIHDFLEYNRSKAMVMAERNAKKEAGHRGGVAKALAGAKARAVADAKHAGKEVLHSRPDPSLPNPKDTDNTLAPLPRRDELFEAICAACAIDWTELTPLGRGPLNKAVAQIRGAGGTPGEVERRSANWPYDDAVLTAPALAKHWASLGSPPPPKPTSLRHQDRAAEILKEAMREQTAG